MMYWAGLRAARARARARLRGPSAAATRIRDAAKSFFASDPRFRVRRLKVPLPWQTVGLFPRVMHTSAHCQERRNRFQIMNAKGEQSTAIVILGQNLSERSGLEFRFGMFSTIARNLLSRKIECACRSILAQKVRDMFDSRPAWASLRPASEPNWECDSVNLKGPLMLADCRPMFARRPWGAL